jgi:hypothetical protein
MNWNQKKWLETKQKILDQKIWKESLENRKVGKTSQKLKEKVSEAKEQFMRRTENIGQRIRSSEGSRKPLKE